MARALVANPTLILADEPTGNLDSKNGQMIMDLLLKCQRELKQTIILVTHNIEYLPLSDTQLYIMDGRITETKRGQKMPEEILKSLDNSNIRVNCNGEGKMIFPKRHDSSKLRSVINPYILISIAVKNLLSKKLRTFLTMTGIVIGVGAVVFLVSLALGLHGVVNQQVLGSKSVNTIDVTTPNSNAILLDDSNVNKVSQFGHVKIVAPAYILAGEINYLNSQTDTVVYGTNNEYITLSALKFVAGAHKLTAANDAIVNTALLSLIGVSNSKSSLHRSLTVSTNVTKANGGHTTIISKLNIVGVVNTGSGAEIYMNSAPYSAAEAAQYGQLKVEADNRGNVPTLRHQIEGLGLTTSSPLDTLDQINKIFAIFTYVVIGFGGIGMVIAVLGMFNTLTVPHFWKEPARLA